MFHCFIFLFKILGQDLNMKLGLKICMKKKGQGKASKKKISKGSYSKSKEALSKNKKKVNQTTVPNGLSLGQKAADVVTWALGSWVFIIVFFVFMVIWIYLNVRAIIGTWDPYPFILLNFVLSCLAAIQAPIILMSQNRQTERDRQSFKYDYQINRKSEREIQTILKELAAIKRHVYKNLKEQKKK